MLVHDARCLWRARLEEPEMRLSDFSCEGSACDLAEILDPCRISRALCRPLNYWTIDVIGGEDLVKRVKSRKISNFLQSEGEYLKLNFTWPFRQQAQQMCSKKREREGEIQREKCGILFTKQKKDNLSSSSSCNPTFTQAAANKYKCLWLASRRHRCMFVARRGMFINFQRWKVHCAINTESKNAWADKWTHRLLMYHCMAEPPQA